MSSPSMTPANQLLLTDSQSNIRFDGFSAPDLSHCSNFSIFSDIDSFFGPELNFEDLGPENQSVGGMQDSASANLENHANGDIESSTATVQSLEVYSHNKLWCPLILILHQEWILSLRKKLKGYFFPANQKLTEERMDEISSDLSQIEKAETIPPNVIRNTKIRRLFRTIMTLEMIPRDNELQIKKRVSGLLKSWGEPAILSNTKAQSKSTRQQIVVDLTGETAGDHEFATPPDTPKSMLLSSSSIGKCLYNLTLARLTTDDRFRSTYQQRDELTPCLRWESKPQEEEALYRF
jgi:hypothetical protein